MPKDFRLAGRQFIVDINLPSETQNGLVLPLRDPSKQDVKPDAYPGTVVEVGLQCKLVWPGDKVVVERWEYSQYMMGDGLMVAREDDLLVLDREIPAPNVIVMHVLPEKTKVLLPEGRALNEDRKYWFGQVISSAYYILDAEGDLEIKAGDFIYVRKFD